MANIKGKIRQSTKLKGKVAGTNEIVAQTVKISSGNISLGDLSNENVAGQTDGAVMMYDGPAGEYKITSEVKNENLHISGGLY